MSKQMKNTYYLEQKYKVEFLLNNFVDKDVQKTLLPLNFFQAFTFCPKYRIKGNFITPNGWTSYLVSFIGTVLYIFFLTWNLMKVIRVEGDLNYLFIYDLFYNNFGFALNFILCLLYSELNIKFVLTIQDVHRYLNDETSLKRFTVWSWVIVIFCFCTVIIYNVFFQQLMQLNFSDLLHFVVVVFDVNQINAMRILKLLEMKVVLWNKEVLKLEEIENEETKLRNSKLLEAFCKISKCYKLFTVIYRHQVSERKKRSGFVK